MKTKVCPRCKVEKETIEFNKSKRAKNGLQSCCKNCSKELAKLNSEKLSQAAKIRVSQYKLFNENNPIRIQTKVCSKCKIEKKAIDFHISKSNKDGINSSCKDCRIQKSRESYPKIKVKLNEFKLWHQNNPIPIQTKVCSKCNIEKEVSQFNKNSTTKNGVTSECIQCRKEYRINNIDKKKLQDKIYYQKNKEHLKSYSKQYKKNNKDYYKDYLKVYKKNNREHINFINNKRRNERMKSDQLFKLSCIIRQTINGAIKRKNGVKNIKTELILGCSIKEFKIRLESQFQPWMNWNNYGNPKDKIFELNKTWDIDHIIPISSAKTEEEILKLNHYTNLQPLCSYTNRIIKKDKI